jgi:hypothetical protein
MAASTPPRPCARVDGCRMRPSLQSRRASAAGASQPAELQSGQRRPERVRLQPASQGAWAAAGSGGQGAAVVVVAQRVSGQVAVWAGWAESMRHRDTRQCHRRTPPCPTHRPRDPPCCDAARRPGPESPRSTRRLDQPCRGPARLRAPTAWASQASQPSLRAIKRPANPAIPRLPLAKPVVSI